MVASSLQLWEILIPFSSNGGENYSLEHHSQWQKYILQRSGGLSISPPISGCWIDPRTNISYTEMMLPVRICCSPHNLEEIIDYKMYHYDQLAVFAYQLSSKVILRERSIPVDLSSSDSNVP